MAERDPVWFPYAQMQTLAPPIEVVGAHGVRLRTTDGRELIDAISSWWCVIHGYNHPDLLAAAKSQVDTLPHVMLGGLVHPQARRLAERLVEITPGDLDHVFFADSGSVGVEVALKMAIQYWQNLGKPEKRRLAALRFSYHGDTTGAMAVCDPVDSMHRLFAPLLPQHLFLDKPTGGYGADAANLAPQIDAARHTLREHTHELAALIVEPIMQGACGFNFYSPKLLRAYRDLCDEFDVLLIFDEVATCLGRTGELFAAMHGAEGPRASGQGLREEGPGEEGEKGESQAIRPQGACSAEEARRRGPALGPSPPALGPSSAITPDIMVVGKALTAGYAGHAATLARRHVYDAFLSDDWSRAFMHGPTYMGNPTVCAIANAGLDVFLRDGYLGRIAHIEAVLRERFARIAGPRVVDTRVLGAVGVVEVDDPSAYDGLQAFAADRGVWLRPFANVAYTAPAYVITDDELHQIADVLEAWFASKT